MASNPINIGSNLGCRVWRSHDLIQHGVERRKQAIENPNQRRSKELPIAYQRHHGQGENDKATKSISIAG